MTKEKILLQPTYIQIKMDCNHAMIYTNNVILTRNVVAPYSYMSSKTFVSDIQKTLESKYGGFCNKEGYIQSGSIHIEEDGISIGIMNEGDVLFEIRFTCNVFSPFEGQELKCRVVEVANIGVHGESADESPSPFILNIHFHHYNDIESIETLKEMKPGDIFYAVVKEISYEQKDTEITIIGSFSRKL